MKENLFEILKIIREKANAFFCSELEKRKVDGICSTHGSILEALYHTEKGYMRMNEVAHKICRTKSTVTELVSKLERLGYVKKVTCPNDHRVTFLKLTKAGMNYKQKHDEITTELYTMIYKGFSEDEKLFLKKMLKRLSNNLDNDLI